MCTGPKVTPLFQKREGDGVGGGWAGWRRGEEVEEIRGGGGEEGGEGGSLTR